MQVSDMETREGVKSPGAVVTGCCNTTDLGDHTTTQVFQKSSICTPNLWVYHHYFIFQ